MEKTFEEKTFGKAALKLIPFLFLLYVIAYIDRINVGFAALGMNEDLKFSDAVYGLGAGIFFIGYFIFEIPSNLILAKVGARMWIARIMVSWGIVACFMMFVHSPLSFYVLRFLLGVTEAGFFPGIILYLTYWFPEDQRAKTVSLFMTATAAAGIIAGPISGKLLTLHGLHTLSGWQWLFLLEGLPAIILGVIVFFWLPDRPEKAKWLTKEEKKVIIDRISLENQKKEIHNKASLVETLTSGKVWAMGLLYFTIMIGMYGVTMWLPLIIKSFSSMNDFQIGLSSAIPYIIAGAGMVLIGAHSDKYNERRRHIAFSVSIAAIGLVLSAYIHQPVPALIALSAAALGIWSALGPFWGRATALMTGAAAAGGIALINSLGNLGGFVGPFLVGVVKNRTGNFEDSLLLLSVILLFGAWLVMSIRFENE
ncbi:MAG: MFS transporter [Firmicutes bacterium]|nr:MFS transporter [Bacillota bacterium]